MFKSITGCVILGTLLLSGCSSAPEPSPTPVTTSAPASPAQGYLDQAQERFAAGDFSKASVMAGLAADTATQDAALQAKARLLQAQSSEKSGDEDKAVEVYMLLARSSSPESESAKKALAERSAGAKKDVSKARELLRGGDAQKALELAQQTLKKLEKLGSEPKELAAVTGLIGRCYVATGDNRRGREELERAFKVLPEDKEIKGALDQLAQGRAVAAQAAAQKKAEEEEQFIAKLSKIRRSEKLESVGSGVQVIPSTVTKTRRDGIQFWGKESGDKYPIIYRMDVNADGSGKYVRYSIKMRDDGRYETWTKWETAPMDSAKGRMFQAARRLAELK